MNSKLPIKSQEEKSIRRSYGSTISIPASRFSKIIPRKIDSSPNDFIKPRVPHRQMQSATPYPGYERKDVAFSSLRTFSGNSPQVQCPLIAAEPEKLCPGASSEQSNLGDTLLNHTTENPDIKAEESIGNLESSPRVKAVSPISSFPRQLNFTPGTIEKQFSHFVRTPIQKESQADKENTSSLHNVKRATPTPKAQRSARKESTAAPLSYYKKWQDCLEEKQKLIHEKICLQGRNTELRKRILHLKTLLRTSESKRDVAHVANSTLSLRYGILGQIGDLAINQAEKILADMRIRKLAPPLYGNARKSGGIDKVSGNPLKSDQRSIPKAKGDPTLGAAFASRDSLGADHDTINLAEQKSQVYETTMENKLMQERDLFRSLLREVLIEKMSQNVELREYHESHIALREEISALKLEISTMHRISGEREKPLASIATEKACRLQRTETYEKALLASFTVPPKT